MGKSKQVRAEPEERQAHTFTCVVCFKEVVYPYSRLAVYERKTHRDCVCCSICNEKYLKGDYDHGR